MDQRSSSIDSYEITKNGCTGGRAIDFDAHNSSAHDHVAETNSANHGVVGATADVDTVSSIAEHRDAICGQPNPVVLDRIAVGRFTVDLNAVLAVTEMKFRRAEPEPPISVPVAPASTRIPSNVIAASNVASDRSANIVAIDHCSSGSSTADHNSIRVPRDRIRLGGIIRSVCIGANQGIGRGSGNEDPCADVSNNRRSVLLPIR